MRLSYTKELKNQNLKIILKIIKSSQVLETFDRIKSTNPYQKKKKILFLKG